MKRIAALLAAGTATVALAAPSAISATSVAVKDDFFSPRSKTISKNSTIKWVWRGDSIHNVVVQSGPSRFRSSLKTSGSYSKRFTRKGRYVINCTVHAGMDMVVRVR